MAEADYSNIPYGVPSPMLGGGFDPNVFYDRIEKRRQTDELTRLSREAKNRDAFNKNFDPRSFVPKEVNEYSVKEIQDIATDLEAKKALAAKEGYDPNNGELKKYFTESEFKMRDKAYKGAALKELIEQHAALTAKDPSKYNADEYIAWRDKVLQGKDVDERLKIAQENPVFTEHFDFPAIVVDWMGENDEDATGQKLLNREQIKARISKNLLLKSPEKQQAMIDEAMLLKDENGNPLGTDVPSLIEGMTDVAMVLGKEDRNRENVSGGGSGNGSGGSGAAAKVNIVTDTLDTQGLAQDGLPNIARVNRLGTQDDLPPIGITSEQGQKINFQPLEFVVNDKTGKIGVNGLKFIPKAGNDLASQIAALQQAKQDKLDGKPISQEAMDAGVEEAMDAGVEETWVDYNRNRTAFEAQTGVDMYKQLGRTDPDKAKKGEKEVQVETTTKKKKFPLPAGKPARGKKNGIWYIWDENTGQYVEE